MSAIEFLPVGLHPGLPEGVYHAKALGVASKSALDEINISPAHYLAWVNGERSKKDSDALSFGRMGHCAIFEPDVFSRRYIAAPDFGDLRFKENKQAKKEWLATIGDQEVAEADDIRTLSGIQKSIHAHQLIRNLLSNGVGELSAAWDDPETGIRCKLRADYYVEKLATVVDLKLVADASPDGFAKAVANRRYHVQDAFYRGGFAALGRELRHFVFVAVEKEAPFASAVYVLSAEAVEAGERSAQSGLRTMATCLEKNTFPGYAPGIQTISLPRWAA